MIMIECMEEDESLLPPWLNMLKNEGVDELRDDVRNTNIKVQRVITRGVEMNNKYLKLCYNAIIFDESVKYKTTTQNDAPCGLSSRRNSAI